MPDIDTDEVTRLTRDIVFAARRAGTLSALTPRIVRAKVEEAMQLESGTLDEKQYKGMVKDATNAAVTMELADVKAGKEKIKEEVNEKGGGNEKAGKVPAPKRKRKAAVSEDEDEGGGASSSKPTSKKAKAAPAKTKENTAPKSANGNPKKATPKSAVRSKSREFKSAEVVEDSDVDEGGDASEVKPKSRSKASTAIASPSSSKSKSKPRTKAPASDAEPESDEPSPAPKPEAASSKAKAKAKEDKSESEDSVLIDDAPPKRKRKSDKEPKQKKVSQKRTRKPAETLSKDEETIKKLKSFVNACGVRKVWSKEFKDISSAGQQISRLREMLNDLGMKGRPSMEQAKKIREERELAKELEDVQQFSKRIVAGKPFRAKAASGEESADDSVMSELPVKRQRTAARDITAFLQDQSSDDE